MNLEGKLLGNRYEIIEQIGNGGMATVYKAKDQSLQRNVAVKILRDEYTTDEEFIKRFEGEAQAAANVTHSNIVSVYDHGVDENLHYIVMELVKGKTLKEIIVEEKGPIPWKWAVNVARQIASALEEAHKNSIVHRDIKPHNIIITEEGVAKVTDFGIAKAVSNSTVTAFGVTMGSVHYFSPEHAKGGYTDAKSDIYSLGVVLYEMVTGKVPFEADTPVSVALKHMQEMPKEPIELNQRVPRAVNLIIMKALEKEMTLRYESAAKMYQDLKKSIKDPDGTFFLTDSNQKMQETQVLKTVEEKDGKIKENSKETPKKKKMSKGKKTAIVISILVILGLIIGGAVFVLTQAKDIEIIDVVGMSVEEAEMKITELGFEVEIEEEYNKDVEEGEIISQDPKFVEGYTLKEGSSIKIVVSKGQETTVVPKLIGLTKAEAIKAIEAVNLKAEIKEDTSKTVEEGYVIDQDIDQDEEIYAGETITITVSSGTGIKMVTMTNIVGKIEENAITTVEDLGLKYKIDYAEDFTKSNGVVIKQSVEEGKEVEEETVVTITVNQYDEETTLPVSINVKSITGGYSLETSEPEVNDEVEDEDGETESEVQAIAEVATKATIVIEVDGIEVYTSSSVDKNTEKVTANIPGRGNSRVVLKITDTDGGVWTRTETINFTEETEISFN